MMPVRSSSGAISHSARSSAIGWRPVAARRRAPRAPPAAPRPRATTGRWRCWATRSTIAPIIGDGSRRPQPATHHTGVPLSAAAAASSAEPVAATTRAAVEGVGLDEHEVGGGDGDRRRFGRHQLATRRRRARGAARTTTPGARRRRPAPRTSPRRASGQPDEVGPADRDDGGAVGQRVGELVDGVVELDLVDRGAGRRPSDRRSSASGRTATTAGRAVGWRSTIRRQATTRPGRVEPEAAQRAGGLPHERLGVGTPAPGRRSAGARSGCTPSRYRPSSRRRSERACWGQVEALATVAPRGDEPTDGPRAGPARCRGAPARGVADDVPPRHRGARPVHQRELVDPADGDPHPRGPARLRRPGQLPGHRRRARRPRVPRPARRASSSCSPIPTASPSRRSASTQLPAFVFVRVDGTVVGRRRGLERGSRGGPSPTRSPRPRRGARPDIPLIGDPGPFHGSPAARLRPAARAARAASSLTSRSSRSSTSCAPRSATTAGPSWPRRRAPARPRSSRWPCSTSRGWRGRRIVVLEPRRLATRAAARRMADADRHRRSATWSATRPATSAASGRDTRIEVRHRGRADPPAAAGPRAARRRRS